MGPVELARIALHIGNRLTPCEIGREAIYIQPDRVHSVTRPFEPQGGAYRGKAPLNQSLLGHGHIAGHAHDYGRKHSPKRSS